MTYDYRGRAIVIANPTAPHTLNKYDNLGRTVAVGLYSSTSGLTASSDPTSVTSNRLALSETRYDARGRVYETVRHKIDDADGSDDDELVTDTWYDAVGRVIKVVGNQVTKTAYDRLGRTTHQYTLAKDSDTAYGEADDVTGDIVMEQTQTAYESTDSDEVLMTVWIGRHHDDFDTGETTGALDTNADSDDLKVTAADVTGRVQITAMWYDSDLGRLDDTVLYGTNGIVGDGSSTTGTFDRDGLSVPTRSDTALRTTNTYNDDGTLQEVTDPEGLVTRFEYDDAGRQTAIIRNYVNGTPSGPTGDDDVYTRYVYTDGLQTKIWVDLDGDDVEDATDQVTTYDYGTTKGTGAGDSKIGTGHLLQKVTYPDSGGASDVVTYAYNAQSQKIYEKDQAGNVIEWDYDDSGREEHRRVTTLASGFDGAVKRITTAYDDLGRVTTVTQYDHATVGSGSVTDEVEYAYEDWGNVETFEQDRNSAVDAGGSVDDYEVKYTYEKSTAGRRTVRRTKVEQFHGSGGGALQTVNYQYNSFSGRHDDAMSRVTRVKYGSTDIVGTYAYTGSSWVVGMDYPEPDVMWKMMDESTTGSYPDLDRFNRVTSSRWTKDLTPTDVDFYDVDLTYDRNGNITLIEDNVHSGFDVDYTIDDLNRLTKAEEGTWSGSAITSRTREQNWTLDQVGNWDVAKLDLDGDNNFNETGEYNDDRTHNVVNELTGRDTDDNGRDDYTLTYDAVGNLTDDGKSYKYEYDAFGRLRKVKKTSDSALVAEYWYNGLGYRITVHEDTDTDGDVDSNDTKFHFAYDEGWRIVATYREDDSDPKEQFINHNAGLDGFGGSSYIDLVILRDRDDTNGWTGSADGTLEERRYYCQNWRADVVAIVTDTAMMVEWDKYSSYGIPFGLPAGDTDSDGDCDSTDITQIQSWIDASAYDVRGDLDLDGDVDATDKSTAQNTYQGTTLGWENLSADAVRNRKGYAGYEFDQPVDLYHVRHRVLHPELGRWTRRDPLEYLAGLHLYNYLQSAPMDDIDPLGLIGGSVGFECCFPIANSGGFLALCFGCSQSETLQPCFCGPQGDELG